MPRFDRSGPQGRGPLTGRRMGPCAGRDGRFSRFGSRGAMGTGLRRGIGRISLEDEKRALEEELKEVESLLRNSEDE